MTATVGERFVLLVLRLRPHLPSLVFDYWGPERLLRAAEGPSPARSELIREGMLLAEEAAGSPGDRESAYVAEQLGGVLAQLQIAVGGTLGYAELCSRMLAVAAEPVAADEIVALRDGVTRLALQVLGRSGTDALRRRDADGLRGGAKVQAVRELLGTTRDRTIERFPFMPDCRPRLVKINDPVLSTGLRYHGQGQASFLVNPAIARASATLLFEVAHNGFPGDLFHLAAQEAHCLASGQVAASVKLKNTPDNVVAEGLEDLALEFLLEGRGTPDVALALALEELRRACAVNASLALREEFRDVEEVRGMLRRDGLMDEGRIRQTLDLVAHPLWGTYVHTYWAGRRLVRPAWERARAQGREAELFTMLYTELLTPCLLGRRLEAAGLAA